MSTQQTHTYTPTHTAPGTEQEAGTPSAQTEQAAERIAALRERVGEVVVGQESMVRGLLIGLLCNGHVLLEGVPGLAKTLAVTTLAKALGADFSRVQFTPDLLPADILGTLIYNPKTTEFTPKKGPIFATLVLADEINRAPAKVQSALLEAMQERAVTIGDTTYPLGDPFLVLATQNPIEQEGAYPLPEAQVDRFLLKLHVGYPTREQEREILDRMSSTVPQAPIEPAATIEDVLTARTAADAVHVDSRVCDYVVDVVLATRTEGAAAIGLAGLIEHGASPRATLSLVRAARANAFLEGRTYATPHDVKAIGADALRHRVILTYEAQAQGLTPEKIVERVFQAVPTP